MLLTKLNFFDLVENNVGQRDNAGYQHDLLLL